MGKMEQTVRGLILCKETGADIRHFLLDNGYADPCTALANMKYTMKTKDPALYDQIKDLSLQRKSRKRETGAQMMKPTETVEIQDKFGGTKRIKLYGENPEDETMALHVCGVRSRLNRDGKYEARMAGAGRDEGFMSFVWRDPVTHSEQFLTMSVSQWELMVMEIPQALRQLHLKA